MRDLSKALAAWLLTAGLPAAAADQPATSQPRMAENHSQLLAPFYPEPARLVGKEGAATLMCRRGPYARLVNCVVSSESPPGFGFGDAALRLADATRDNPRAHYGPQAAQILLPVTFRFSPREPYITPDIFSNTWGQPSIITAPILLERPSGRDVSAVYPRQAIKDRISGYTLLNCKIGLDQHVVCVVGSEDPPGYGFGEAALKLSGKFRFTPATVDGAPVAGLRVNIPIRFALAPNK